MTTQQTSRPDETGEQSAVGARERTFDVLSVGASAMEWAFDHVTQTVYAPLTILPTGCTRRLGHGTGEVVYSRRGKPFVRAAFVVEVLTGLAPSFWTKAGMDRAHTLKRIGETIADVSICALDHEAGGSLGAGSDYSAPNNSTAMGKARMGGLAVYGQAFAAMPDEAQQDLREWIDLAIKPAKRVHTDDDDDLRHIYEQERHRATGTPRRYVTSDQFRGAMLAAGYLPVKPKDADWKFRIARKCCLGRIEANAPFGTVECPHPANMATGLCSYHRARQLQGLPIIPERVETREEWYATIDERRLAGRGVRQER